MTEPCPRCPQKRPAERPAPQTFNTELSEPRWNGSRRPSRETFQPSRIQLCAAETLWWGKKKKTQPDFRSLRAAVSVSQKEKPRTRLGVEKRDDLKQFSKTLQRSHWISQCRISIKRYWTVRCKKKKTCSISRHCLWIAENWNSFLTSSWVRCTSSFIKHHEQIIWEVGSKIFSIRRFCSFGVFFNKRTDFMYKATGLLVLTRAKLASFFVQFPKQEVGG